MVPETGSRRPLVFQPQLVLEAAARSCSPDPAPLCYTGTPLGSPAPACEMLSHSSTPESEAAVLLDDVLDFGSFLPLTTSSLSSSPGPAASSGAPATPSLQLSADDLAPATGTQLGCPTCLPEQLVGALLVQELLCEQLPAVCNSCNSSVHTHSPVEDPVWLLWQPAMLHNIASLRACLLAEPPKRRVRGTRARKERAPVDELPSDGELLSDSEGEEGPRKKARKLRHRPWCVFLRLCSSACSAATGCGASRRPSWSAARSPTPWLCLQDSRGDACAAGWH